MTVHHEGVGSLAEQLMVLLLEDAPIDVFEKALADAAQAADARDEVESADVRRQIDVSIRLKTLLERYKRRAGELSALYETAGDLSSLRDVERVLHAIVGRSRQLLQTDVAYLMLIDEERGDTYMRVTDRTVTPDFINIRLPLGIGLGGLVAQTAAPQWTGNYLADTRYQHTIDAIVDEEHLIAILGVPLKVGRRVIGVLFAADRHPRSFAQEEVLLLSSLGAHAAIAIENASLFQETQAALASLTEATSVIEKQNEALRRASGMHERLTNILVAGGRVHDLACTVADVLGGALLVVDADGRVTARAGTTPGGTWQAIDVADVLTADRSSGSALVPDVVAVLEEARTSRRSAQARVDGVVVRAAPVIAAADYLGSLLLIGAELDEADSRALERAATVTALLRLNERARDEAENRVRGELLTELLRAPIADMESVRRRAELTGVHLECPLTVLVAIAGTLGTAPQVRAAATKLARAGRGLVTTYGGSVVLLLPGGDAAALAHAAARRLNEASPTPVTVGAAGPLLDLAEVSGAERQARRCARTLLLLGREGQGSTPAELGIYGLLLSEADRDQVQGLLAATLGPLEQYDAQRGTVLLDTVEQYFEHDGNAAHTASSLFVHVNTLYQRLDRVDAILGPTWRHGDRALEIRLALRLRRLEVGDQDTGDTRTV
jgi:GAF domain-containing protein/sugar diacid utilization regulator